MRHLARQLGQEAAATSGALLDLGCGGRPYAPLFTHLRYLGIDLASVHGRPDVLAVAERVPLRSSSFDVVLSTQQLEHVNDPTAVLAEARRLLRPGGRLLLSTHGVWVHHPDPSDLWRWTEQGLVRLIEEAGFSVERVHHQGEVVAAAAVLLAYPLGAMAHRRGLIARLLRPLLAAGLALASALDRVATRPPPAPGEPRATWS